MSSANVSLPQCIPGHSSFDDGSASCGTTPTLSPPMGPPLALEPLLILAVEDSAIPQVVLDWTEDEYRPLPERPCLALQRPQGRETDSEYITRILLAIQDHFIAPDGRASCVVRVPYEALNVGMALQRTGHARPAKEGLCINPGLTCVATW
jgi:hypothetical protein